MSNKRTLAARSLSLLLISACTMSAVLSDDITLTAAKDGQRVMLTLHNESGGPVGYNLCTSALQRKVLETWETIEIGDICTMKIRTLNHGQSATFEKTLPAESWPISIAT